MVRPEKFGHLYFSIKDFFSKYGFGHISWKNPKWETLFFVQYQ